MAPVKHRPVREVDIRLLPEIRKRKKCLPIVYCKRPFVIVPFEDDIFSEADPPVIG